MNPSMEFEAFPKIARLKRETAITEKLDGTNAQVAIFELDCGMALRAAYADPYCLSITDGADSGESALAMYAGSRKRWIAPEGTEFLGKGCDNFAFAQFVSQNSDELFKLGPGRHYGEWYGKGIQRGYGLEEKRFALFNTARWGDHNPNTPECCEVVPDLTSIIHQVYGEEATPDMGMDLLADEGSSAAPGFMNPEGIVVYHTASRTLYKQTFEQDGGKWRES